MVFEDIGGLELTIFAFLAFAFLIAGGIIVFIVLGRMKWNYKAFIAESVGNQSPQITRRTRARLIAFGDGGEEIFLLKKPRKLKAAYGKRIGLRQVLWVIGEDGLWYNSDFGSFNKKLLELGVKPVDRDVRLANSSIRKGIEKNYGKTSFMEKYGELVKMGLFFMMVLAFVGLMWFAFDQQKKITSANLEAVRTSEKVMDATAEILRAQANLREGGSGYDAET